MLAEGVHSMITQTPYSCTQISRSSGRIPSILCTSYRPVRTLPSHHMLIYTCQTARSSPDVSWPMNHPRILNTGQHQLAMRTERLLMSGLPSVTQAMASNGLLQIVTDRYLDFFQERSVNHYLCLVHVTHGTNCCILRLHIEAT